MPFSVFVRRPLLWPNFITCLLNDNYITCWLINTKGDMRTIMRTFGQKMDADGKHVCTIVALVSCKRQSSLVQPMSPCSSQ